MGGAAGVDGCLDGLLFRSAFDAVTHLLILICCLYKEGGIEEAAACFKMVLSLDLFEDREMQMKRRR